MSPEQRAEFQQIILDHAERPVGEGRLADASETIDARQPETGDTMTLYLGWDTGRQQLVALRWEASGSAVLRASCSLMAQAAVERSRVAPLRAHAERFLEMLTGPAFSLEDPQWQTLGDALAMSGLRHLPARVRCATFPWRTLLGALKR